MRRSAWLLALSGAALVAACGADEAAPPPPRDVDAGGSGGGAGSAGQGALAGSGGRAGASPAGASGSSGANAGTAGAGGSGGANAGSAGSNAGSAGSNAGSAGSNAGSAGSNAGSAGSNAGSAGSSAGSAGSNAGSAGSSAGSAGSNAGSAGSNAGSAGSSAGSAGQGGSSAGQGGSSAGTGGSNAGGGGASAGSGGSAAGAGGGGANAGAAGASAGGSGAAGGGGGNVEPATDVTLRPAVSTKPVASTAVTFPGPAPLDGYGSIGTSIAIDAQGREHVAWIRTQGGAQELMYSVVDGEQVTTKQITSTEAIGERNPCIVLDDAQRPHFTFVGIRSEDSGASGSAIFYAGDGDGDGTFTVTQVSTNPVSGTASVDTRTMSERNALPSIAVGADGKLLITYSGNSFFPNCCGSRAVVARSGVLDGVTWAFEAGPDYPANSRYGDSHPRVGPRPGPDEEMGLRGPLPGSLFRSAEGIVYTPLSILGLDEEGSRSDPIVDRETAGPTHFGYAFAEGSFLGPKKNFLVHGVLAKNVATKIEKIPADNLSVGSRTMFAVDAETGAAFLMNGDFGAWIVARSATGPWSAHSVSDTTNARLQGVRTLAARKGKVSVSVVQLDGNVRVRRFATTDLVAP